MFQVICTHTFVKNRIWDVRVRGNGVTQTGHRFRQYIQTKPYKLYKEIIFDDVFRLLLKQVPVGCQRQTYRIDRLRIIIHFNNLIVYHMDTCKFHQFHHVFKYKCLLSSVGGTGTCICPIYSKKWNVTIKY
jgi:hypothetical protein